MTQQETISCDVGLQMHLSIYNIYLFVSLSRLRALALAGQPFDADWRPLTATDAFAIASSERHGAINRVKNDFAFHCIIHKLYRFNGKSPQDPFAYACRIIQLDTTMNVICIYVRRHAIATLSFLLRLISYSMPTGDQWTNCSIYTLILCD